MLQIQGLYKSGAGAAAGNLARQLPLIKQEFAEIAGVQPGTINIHFESKLIVAGWDHRTQPIIWSNPSRGGEIFDIVRVHLSFPEIGAESHEAFLYVAHWSGHRNDPHSHEFLASPIRGLRHGMKVVMECNRPHVELPYTEQARESNPRRLARTIVIL